MLNKDVQDIIEGVHYFLSESLSCEQLTGKAECLRNALVLQLEALAVNYPTLKLHKSPSYPYLNMDQGDAGGGGSGTSSVGGSGSGTVQAKRSLLANEGSGSSVCSNSSNSGDPFTFPPKLASSTKTGGRPKSKGDADEEDEYEELDQDFLRSQVNKYTKEKLFESSQTPLVVGVPPAESTSGPSCPTTSSSNPEQTPEAVADMDDPEENYMTTVPNVAFSTLIAKSEKNGELLKKTKGILRNIKKYHGVVANQLLYLYLKETDEAQKKVIDLTQYTARVATGDDFKDQRKKDAAFELVGVGMKTHTFVARTAKDKNQWLAAIQRVSTVDLSDTQELPMASKQDHDKPSILILPPKPPPPMSVKDPKEEGSVPVGTKEVPEEEDNEFYEELDVNLPPSSNPSSVFASSTSTSKPSVPTKNDDNNEVNEEVEPIPPVPPVLPVINTPGLIPKKFPPDRPPLPLRLQHVLQQKLRPLPVIPGSSVPSGEANEEDVDDIYCEIDEEVDGEQPTVTHTPGLNIMKHLPIPPKNTSHSEISSLSNDTLSDELYEEPDINLDPPPSQFRKAYTPVVSTPPKLPPRGIPTQHFPADSIDYKVPQSLDTEYQVPQSNPVQANSNSQVKKDDIPTYQVPPSNVAVTSATQPTTEGTCNNSVEKKTSDSFRAQISVFQNIKSFEKREQICQKEAGSQDKDKNKKNIHTNFNTDRAKEPESVQEFSVKDIISRMNKNNTSKGGTSGNTISNKVQTSVTKDSQRKPNSVTNTQKDKDKTNLISEGSLIKHKLPEPQKNGVDKDELDNGVMEEVKDTEISNSDLYENYDCGQPEEQGEWYIAKFSYIASIPQSIGFDRGDQILIVDKSGDTGWWMAVIKGRTGFVPKEYIRKKE